MFQDIIWVHSSGIVHKTFSAMLYTLYGFQENVIHKHKFYYRNKKKKDQ